MKPWYLQTLFIRVLLGSIIYLYVETWTEAVSVYCHRYIMFFQYCHNSIEFIGWGILRCDLQVGCCVVDNFCFIRSGYLYMVYFIPAVKFFSSCGNQQIVFRYTLFPYICQNKQHTPWKDQVMKQLIRKNKSDDRDGKNACTDQQNICLRFMCFYYYTCAWNWAIECTTTHIFTSFQKSLSIFTKGLRMLYPHFHCWIPVFIKWFIFLYRIYDR